MTINIASNVISIRNSAGTTKFTSDNKLAYQKYYQIGYIKVDGNVKFVPFTKLEDKDFLVINIKILSGTGQADLMATLANKIIPANGPIMVDFYARNVSNQPAADSELMGVDSIGSNLVFKTYRLTNDGTFTNGSATVDVLYYARVWSYL